MGTGRIRLVEIGLHARNPLPEELVLVPDVIQVADVVSRVETVVKHDRLKGSFALHLSK